MKTKLLKKLRKEANEIYKIKSHKNGNFIVVLCGEYELDCGCNSRIIDDIYKNLLEYRRKYICNAIKIMKSVELNKQLKKL
jgi:predicted nucleotide-binding protein (sugar kinase/HSP70/actin superfamily)